MDYVLDENKLVVTIENEILPIIELELLKVDTKGNPVEGAEFSLYVEELDEYMTGVTDEHGIIIFDIPLYIPEFDESNGLSRWVNFTLQEISVPEGYLLDASPIEGYIDWYDGEICYVSAWTGNVINFVIDSSKEKAILTVENEIYDPSYTIEKTLKAGQRNPVIPGETVKYVVTVTNTGEIDLHNLVITDDLDLGGLWTKTIATLPHTTGNVVSYEFTYTVPTTATNNQVIKNTATVVSDEIPEPTTNCKNITVKVPSYTIEKTLKAGQRNPVIPGETVTYVITVTNTGTIDLHNLIITGNLDLGGLWTKTIATLPHTTSNVVSYEFTYTVPTTATNNQIIKNIATVVSDEITEPTTDDVDITVKVPSYTISKTLKPGQALPILAGDTVDYVITVTNIGEIDIHNLIITDSLDVGGLWTKTIATLPHTTSNVVSYEFTYTVPLSTPEGTVIKNIATVECDELNSITDEKDVIVNMSGITINKTLKAGQRNPVIPGETVTYVITVTNTGTIDLHNLIITDDLNPTWTKTITTLPHTTSNVVSYEFTYTVPVTSTDNQIIKNTAAVKCNEINKITDDEDITVKIPSYTIEKVLKPGQRNPVIPGETVTYVITVTNTGTIDLHNLIITDNLDTAESWTKTIAILPHTTSNVVSYEFTYMVPETATDNQVIKNVATVVSDEIPVPKTDDVDVTVKIPGYTIEKTLKTGQKNPVIPGGTIDYVITVTNTGTIDLHNVVITDNLDIGGIWTKTITTLPHTTSNVASYEFTYTVPITATNNQVITNTAIVDCDELSPKTDSQDITVKREVDLALKNFITKINGENIAETNEPVKVEKGDIIVYTIRVYNEGEMDAYAQKVINNIPAGMEFVTGDPINITYNWVLEGGKLTTDYLSKETSLANLILAFDPDMMTKPEYMELQIVFKIIDNTSDMIIENISEIGAHLDKYGEVAEDKDSNPNNNNPVEDDQDSSFVKIKEFNLALTQNIVKIIINEAGAIKEIYPSDLSELMKVEINSRKIESTEVSIVYNIEIENIGEVAGYAKKIKDYIPEGLEFIKASLGNEIWSELSYDVVETNALSGILLAPGETASIQITLKWLQNGENMNTKMNIAEISEIADKYNERVNDVSSIPNNKAMQENDLDITKVLFAVNTGGIGEIGGIGSMVNNMFALVLEIIIIAAIHVNNGRKKYAW